MLRILVVGAGVAGLSVAHWLGRNGVECTVVEQAPTSRLSGQAIDVRGVALTVAEEMGVLPDLLQVRTRMRGMTLLAADGSELEKRTDWALSSGALNANTGDQAEDLEVMREDLLDLLDRALPDSVDVIYGDTVVSLEQGDEVGVRFDRGQPRTFDLVVGADGVHSTIRRLAFGQQDRVVRHLGKYLATFTADNFLQLRDWQLWHLGQRAGFGVYPMRDNTELRVALTFSSQDADLDRLDVPEQKSVIASQLAHLGGPAPDLLDAMRRSSDLYFDVMAQVRMSPWWRGRVVLAGDSAHCASPLSGQGTSLALVGAYVLGYEVLATPTDHERAFAAYERRMRPFVQANQALVDADVESNDFLVTFERAKSAIALPGLTDQHEHPTHRQKE